MKTDVAWKNILEDLFPQFVEFFIPNLYEIIDFEKKPKFLNQEFSNLFPESDSENRRVDKLVEITLKNGNLKLVLLHIEIQSYEDNDFDKRMFQYYIRIFDKFEKEIETIAIFTYKDDRHKYNNYRSQFLDTKITYEYKTYDVAKQDIQKLKYSNNPFSFVIRTLIKGFEHKSNDENNFNFKKELIGLLFKSGFSQYEIRKLLRFLNFVLEIKNNEIRNKFYLEVIEMSTIEKFKLELTDFEQAALEIESEKIKKNNSKQIAKNFKELGIEVEKISNATGLSVEEIENL